jgi:hypothetical protein
VLWASIAAISLNGCVVAASSGDGDGGAGLFLLFLPFLLFAVTAWSIGRRGRRARTRRWARDELDGGHTVNRELLRAELSVLADDVLRLEPQVTINEAARDDFEAAMHRYRVAHAALQETDAQVDLVRVQRVVDEATWSMSRVRAILDGRTPPAPPAPLQRPGPRGEPALGVDERERPVYVDAPVEYRSGWFAGGGGLFGGLLLGSMLGGFGGAWMVDGGDDGDDGWTDEGWTADPGADDAGAW